jgi:hypothetical protein
MTANQLVALAIVVFVCLVAAGLAARTESIRHGARRLVAAGAFGVFAFWFASESGVRQDHSQVFGVLTAVGMFAAFPKRRRRIRESDRRRAIARFELKTGKKFNPRRHELDHVIPFSRGGNSTADNLEVVEKARNRRKGSRAPGWDPFSW